MMPIRRVCLWSGPRNISTALMYSFAQRSDTRVIDEPLYGHYLRVSGARHPGREEVLSAMESDGETVVREVTEDLVGRGLDRIRVSMTRSSEGFRSTGSTIRSSTRKNFASVI